MVSYFKARWPENPIPKGEPQWIYYEVVAARDVVSRIIDQFDDGRLIRDSIELSQREGSDARPPEYGSLVHGAFFEHAGENLIPISAEEFTLLWGKARDKPWPPEKDEG